MGALYRQAVGGNVTAQIFWLKNKRQEVFGDRLLTLTPAQLEKLTLEQLERVANGLPL